MSTSAKKVQVFVSYSSKDKLWADAACAVLESKGVRCWIAPRDIAPGSEWGASIIAGIDACRIMVLIFSDHANQSPQVRREVERAVSKGLVIVPCRVEDVRPVGALEYALSNTHWLDIFTPPMAEQLGRLADAVQALATANRTQGSVPGAVSPRRAAAPPAWKRSAGWIQMATVLVIFGGGILVAWVIFNRPKESSPTDQSQTVPTKDGAAAKGVGAPAGGGGAAEPRAAAKEVGSDGTEYELLKCVRAGNTLTFTFSAVNKVKDTMLGGGGAFALSRDWRMSLTARNGELLNTRVESQPPVRLTKGIAEPFQLKVGEVGADISVLETVSLWYKTGGFEESVPVKFRNIKIE